MLSVEAAATTPIQRTYFAFDWKEAGCTSNKNWDGTISARSTFTTVGGSSTAAAASFDAALGNGGAAAPLQVGLFNISIQSVPTTQCTGECFLEGSPKSFCNGL